MPLLKTLSLIVLAAALGGACAQVAEPKPPLSLQGLYASADPSALEPDEDLESEWYEVVDHGWHDPHPELERLLEENADTLAVLHERTGSAEALAGLASEGHEPKLRQARRLQHLLLLEGRRHERARRHDDALGSALVALRFAHRHLHEGGVPLIVHITGQALQREALSSINALVHRSRTSEEAWRRCLDELATLRADWPDMEPSLRNDAVFLTALTEEGFREEGILDDPQTQRVLERLDVISEDSIRLFLEAHRQGRPEILRQEFEERERELESPLAMLGTLVSEERSAEHSAELIAYIGHPNLGAILEVDMSSRLALDMLRVAIAGRLFWSDNGRAPLESLEQLIPDYLEAIPEDLFALGEPVRLARQGENWWIYSVGPDRTDQGGLVDYASGNPEAGGDVLSVPDHCGLCRH